MKSIEFRLVLLVGLAAQSPHLYAAAPLEASMDILSSAVFDGAVDFDQDSDAWGVILSPLGIHSSAVMLNASNQPVVEAGVTGEASWLDANHGNVNFSDIGWNFYTDGPNGASHSSLSSTNWRYRFLAEQDGYFRIHAVVIGQGSDLFGLNGFGIVLNGGPEGARFTDHIDSDDPTNTWDFEASLTQGAVYTASLYMASNISGGGARTASMSGQFDWHITPEPSATLILATALSSALALKRR